jgi:hypothetical protein
MVLTGAGLKCRDQIPRDPEAVCPS